VQQNEGRNSSRMRRESAWNIEFAFHGTVPGTGTKAGDWNFVQTSGPAVEESEPEVGMGPLQIRL